MYKVFFNNKVLYITPIHLQDVLNIKSFQYAEVHDLSILINKLFNNWDHKEIVEIISDSVIDCWKDFCSYFKIILASGGIVQNQKGEFLFIVRHGKWDLPKGKCEKKESPEKCAEREIEEECGISGLILRKKITDTFHTYVLKGQPVLKQTCWYSFDYVGSDPLIPQTEENITEVKWLHQNEIKTVFPNTYLSILDVIKKSGII